MVTWDEYVVEVVSWLAPLVCVGGSGVALLVLVLVTGPEDT